MSVSPLATNPTPPHRQSRHRNPQPEHALPHPAARKPHRARDSHADGRRNSAGANLGPRPPPSQPGEGGRAGEPCAAHPSSRRPAKEPPSPPRDPGWSPGPPVCPSTGLQGWQEGTHHQTHAYTHPRPPTRAMSHSHSPPTGTARHGTPSGPPSPRQGRVPRRCRRHPADTPAPNQRPATERRADAQPEKRGEGGGRRTPRNCHGAMQDRRPDPPTHSHGRQPRQRGGHTPGATPYRKSVGPTYHPITVAARFPTGSHHPAP
ncbi:proline-rich protein 2-like [Corythoichthys intestinalis]|uniref:proline-rich protein 2-like n=1 Tax=Corythoichthys intestinalis TaxID=161448 RepID=UPI0025A5448E|nr:proline-rich protein 2-like [Corythoichthys intestinalis]